jgi:hypothetical protein
MDSMRLLLWLVALAAVLNLAVALSAFRGGSRRAGLGVPATA